MTDTAMALAEVIKRVIRGKLDFDGILMHVSHTCVGFRAHRDLATKFHFIVFPYRFIPTVHDLTPSDLFMVMSLVKHSREYVWNNWGSFHGVQMGFLKDAEIGYLHMHVLIGPLTEYGWSKRHDWVNVDQVLDMLSHN
jgi:diadenosine tetraphosphate (Ap4A) HIT family hydrolase